MKQTRNKYGAVSRRRLKNGPFSALGRLFLELWWSDWAEIRTRARFYEYLAFYRGFFENFDFFQNGGHFNPKWRPFLIQNGRHFGKNRNFQKMNGIFLDIHPMQVWSKFQPNRTTTAPRILVKALKKVSRDITQWSRDTRFFLKKGAKRGEFR